MKNQLAPTTFSLWIDPLNPVDFQRGVVTVETPDAFFANWVQRHYAAAILSALQALDATVSQVVFIPRNNPAPEAAAPVGEASSAKIAVQQNAGVKRGWKGNNLNHLYTFENFIIGESNRLAHAAALSVAQSPGTAYNPLFIYGQVGVGKTHLMQAIGNFIKTQGDVKIAYLSSEQFLNEFIESIQNKNTASFRNRFRELDLLLIDDIQFIGGKEETQREFFHTFNTLYDYHKQVILSSDRPPKELKNLEKRLVSRFEWGLVVDIQPPDLETRIAIINHKARLKNFPLDSAISLYIAEKIKGNTRMLEGALNKLIACAGLYEKKEIDRGFVVGILKDFSDAYPEKRPVTIPAIQEWVAGYFNMKISDLKSDRRLQTLILPRQLAMFFSRKLTGASLPQIGESFGGKNHATVIHACQRIEDKLQKDSTFKDDFERMLTKIKQELNVG